MNKWWGWSGVAAGLVLAAVCVTAAQQPPPPPLPPGLKPAPVTECTSFSAMFSIEEKTAPTPVPASWVTPAFFKRPGANLFLGRWFDENDLRADVAVAIISYPMYAKYFADNPSVVGTSILVNGRPYTIAGVGTEGFQPPEAGMIWMPRPPGLAVGTSTVAVPVRFTGGDPGDFVPAVQALEGEGQCSVPTLGLKPGWSYGLTLTIGDPSTTAQKISLFFDANDKLLQYTDARGKMRFSPGEPLGSAPMTTISLDFVNDKSTMHNSGPGVRPTAISSDAFTARHARSLGPPDAFIDRVVRECASLKPVR